MSQYTGECISRCQCCITFKEVEDHCGRRSPFTALSAHFLLLSLLKKPNTHSRLNPKIVNANRYWESTGWMADLLICFSDCTRMTSTHHIRHLTVDNAHRLKWHRCLPSSIVQIGHFLTSTSFHVNVVCNAVSRQRLLSLTVWSNQADVLWCG